MTVKSKPVVTVTTPSDRELVITAVVDAPRALVFEACTKPEHVKHWWGRRRVSMTGCEVDLRSGGASRYVARDWGSWLDDALDGVGLEVSPMVHGVNCE